MVVWMVEEAMPFITYGMPKYYPIDIF